MTRSLGQPDPQEEAMADKTVTSMFDNAENASAAVNRLEDAAGIPRSGITVFDSADARPAGSEARMDATDRASGSLADRLADLGVDASDAHAYAEGVRRGHVLVVVECGEDDVDGVISILDSAATMDLDDRQTAWRSEGWTGLDRSAAGAAAADSITTGSRAGVADTTNSGGTGSSRTARTSGEREEVIPLAEEELQVGKREVSKGRVRIHTRVVERPVQEEVMLRQEHVDVERRPAAGTIPAGAAGADAFRERIIEVEERGEEPVVAKEPRVTEELVVRKGEDQRTETVSDTVRRTEVEVEDERRDQKTGTTDRDKV
jgi:uncharacterized protein (TIGR02271 family)